MPGGSGPADVAQQACVVRIKTFKNQDYIFATNRRRENVGASELVHRVGTRFVLDAVAQLTGTAIYDDEAEELFQRLLDPQLNRRIEDGAAVEVVIAASGTALLLADAPEHGRRIVAAVTERAAREAPGLLVRGAVSEAFRFGSADGPPVHLVIADTDAKLDALASAFPGPAGRFLRLPVVAPCVSSGLPAHRIDDQGPEADACSREILAKRAARDDGWNRITAALRSSDGARRLPRSIDDLDRLEGADWLAVVHADGNRIGSLLTRFHEHVGVAMAGDARRYIDQLRRFSVALDRCGLKAFAQCLRELPLPSERAEAAEGKLAVVPLVLGGDDLTVVCDGRLAILLAERYLAAFERLSADAGGEDGNILPLVAFHHTGIARLTCAAGVAVVKPHFPFHAAYDLAEELARSAKSLSIGSPQAGAAPVSALDFHVHFDSSGADLGAIRRMYARSSTDAGSTEIRLIARPYLATPVEFMPDATGTPAILKFRHTHALRKAAALLLVTEEDEKEDDANSKNEHREKEVGAGRTIDHAKDARKTTLPRTQQHWLRDGLFVGNRADVSEARLSEMRHRYPQFSWIDLLGGDGDKLFLEDASSTGRAGKVTRLLDAIDLADLAQRTENLGNDPG